MQPFAPFGLDIPTNPVVIFLSRISSPSRLPSNPASPHHPPSSTFQPTNNSRTTIPDVAPFLSIGLKFSICLPEDDHPLTTKKRPPFHSLLSDVGPLVSRPNHHKFHFAQSTLGRQHRRECYINWAPKIRRPRFNHDLHYNLYPEFSLREKLFWDSRRQEYTIRNTSLPL